MASKWNGQPCCLCGVGTLHDGIKTVTQQYKGQLFNSETHGAFCDHCDDGFVMADEAEEARWLAFREVAEQREAQDKMRLMALREAANIGVADIEAGRFEIFDSDEAIDQYLVALTAEAGPA